MLSSQLSGDHLLEKSKIKLRWGLNYSKTQSAVPNLKRMLYTKNGTPQGNIARLSFHRLCAIWLSFTRLTLDVFSQI